MNPDPRKIPSLCCQLFWQTVRFCGPIVSLCRHLIEFRF